MEFTGFTPAATRFFDELAADNTREFWSSTGKATYEHEVKAPFTALAEELADEFGEVTLFRPHRDIRFSKDKSPYKTYAAGFAGVAPGIGRYVEVSAAGLLVGGGFHVHGSGQVERYRAAVDSDGPGTQLARVTRDLQDAG